MRTEASCSTRGIQGFSSRGSARHGLSIPFVFRATIERSAFFRAKESSGSGSGTTTTTTAFSRAIEDLPSQDGTTDSHRDRGLWASRDLGQPTAETAAKAHAVEQPPSVTAPVPRNEKRRSGGFRMGLLSH